MQTVPNPMKRLALIMLAIACMQVAAMAQSQKGFYIAASPLAILEPQAAYGLAVGYTVNENFDVSTEYARLSKPTWTDEGQYVNLKGMRSITTFRFTTATDEWRRTKNFVAAELRYKKFSFDDTQDFTNTTTHATLKDYQFRNTTQIYGLAAIIGKQRDLCESGKLVLEVSAGIGLRYTKVNRDNTPANSYIVPVDTGLGEMPNYRNDQTSLYFPLSLKLIVRL